MAGDSGLTDIWGSHIKDSEARKRGLRYQLDANGNPYLPAGTYANEEQRAAAIVAGDQSRSGASAPLAALQRQAVSGVSGIDPSYYSGVGERIRALDPTSYQGANALKSALATQQQYATGDQSISRQMGELGQQRLATQLASQYSANRGRMSGAALRGAQYALGRSSADLAASTAVQAAQEKQAALAQYANLAQAENARAASDAVNRGNLLSAASGQQANADSTAANVYSLYAADRNRAQDNALARWQLMLGQSPVQDEPGFGQKIGGLAGGILGSAGSALASVFRSDRRDKTDVEPDAIDVDEFLDQLRAYRWRYKEPQSEGASPGEHTGVMAQDLKKSKLGKDLVEDHNGHLMVDYSPGKINPIVLAALARLNERLSKVE